MQTCSPLLDEFTNQGGISCTSPVEAGKGESGYDFCSFSFCLLSSIFILVSYLALHIRHNNPLILGRLERRKRKKMENTGLIRKVDSGDSDRKEII